MLFTTNTTRCRRSVTKSCLHCNGQTTFGQRCKLPLPQQPRLLATLHAVQNDNSNSKRNQISPQSTQEADNWDPLDVRAVPDNASSQQTQQQRTDDDKEYTVFVRAALAALAFYRNVLSPMMPSRCRYVPSCSNYSIQSYKEFGFWKGGVLTVWRLLRCQPLGGPAWSYDPPKWPPPGLEFMYGEQYVGWLIGTNMAVVLAALWWQHGFQLPL